MGHRGIVMQPARRGCSGTDAFVPASFFGAGKSTLTAFEICLRGFASFQEKLRQLLGK
jgi:UDP-N-acetylglucosamine enolpyruvyl transferase